MNLRNGIAKVVEECDFAEENQYDEIYNLAEKYLKLRDRILKIKEELFLNIENSKMESVLTKIEEILESHS